MELTLSVIKADVGGYVGHSDSHPACLKTAQDSLAKAKKDGILVDYYVTKCDDDLQLIMTHQKGKGNEEIHRLSWDTFVCCTDVAKELGSCGAGQDLLSDAWMRGSHHGPLMPVSMEESTPTRFDGPPRVVAYGFQLTNGKLVGPRDMFADNSFDNSRQAANDLADIMHRHGPFEPHRLPLEEIEYTTMPMVQKKLTDRFKPIAG